MTWELASGYQVSLAISVTLYSGIWKRWGYGLNFSMQDRFSFCLHYENRVVFTDELDAFPKRVGARKSFE